jgi:hypothetical protein
LIEFFGSFFSRKKKLLFGPAKYSFPAGETLRVRSFTWRIFEKRIRDLEEEIAAPSVDGCWW